MADGTKIEWTDATVNFLNGCTVLTPGCTNCYAMRLAGTRLRQHPTRRGLTIDTKAGPVWTGEVRPHWPALAQVLSWTRPRMIFWNAHGDLFHDDVPDEFIDAVFAACALTPQHRHQLLTKRSPRMLEYYNRLDMDGGVGRVGRFAAAMGLILDMTDHPAVTVGRGVPFVPHPLPNVWMGVSAEDQRRWDERVADLRQINAAVRWVSAEPLLGPIDDGDGFMQGIDWLVAGGESGPGARPMHPDWPRSLRDQCAAGGVPFLFKQNGEWAPIDALRLDGAAWLTDGPISRRGNVRDWMDRYVTFQNDAGAIRVRGHSFTGHATDLVYRVGKKAAGRLLDGVQHDGYPTQQEAI